MTLWLEIQMRSHPLIAESFSDTEANPFLLLLYVTGLWLMLPGLIVYFLARSLYYSALLLSNELFRNLARLMAD